MTDEESSIVSFMHCKKCMEELPEGISPRDWQRNEAGFTAEGMQVWCVRHKLNVIHIDFEGQKHPAISPSSSRSLQTH